jgi:competence protein ComGC
MKNKVGKSFVMIMVIIAICALLLRIAVKEIIKLNITQNESHALDIIKLISTALENYAKDNHGTFPTNFSLLTQGKPAYLDKDYINISPFRGYIFDCSKLEAGGYSCTATPMKCKLSGNMVYNVITGGILISDECSKREKELT